MDYMMLEPRTNECIVKKQLLIRMFSHITIKSMNKKRCFK